MTTTTRLHPADEKARLIADIRRMLPLLAMGHPGLSAEIERAMDLIEGKRSMPIRLLADDQTRLAVGVEVVVMDVVRQKQGIIVKMGDEDDHPGLVLVWHGADSEYPCWWNADYVVPLAQTQP